ncbi:hypothetical protein BDY21DRAFT_365908 [Lineolata rhizophorae]|uniref:Uncharacterized protein n=1 Tax=Lineolata rhizophorae TaxID=578093 RepID=A0A6A6NT33_9PEZI|nr:hypothetical protein BDY21DRAFT_365908 [Lineolata rhizophorae]
MTDRRKVLRHFGPVHFSGTNPKRRRFLDKWLAGRKAGGRADARLGDAARPRADEIPTSAAFAPRPAHGVHARGVRKRVMYVAEGLPAQVGDFATYDARARRRRRRRRAPRKSQDPARTKRSKASRSTRGRAGRPKAAAFSVVSGSYIPTTGAEHARERGANGDALGTRFRDRRVVPRLGFQTARAAAAPHRRPGSERAEAHAVLHAYHARSSVARQAAGCRRAAKKARCRRLNWRAWVVCTTGGERCMPAGEREKAGAELSDLSLKWPGAAVGRQATGDTTA